ncbi:hypothetical protein [Amycolatopsis sp. GM8]|uniref:hypothetical protein n=1 Tax=Amycolatopsis sp. GM8 TaxID=2896530 RepID=UPI001F360769|nr:hypothetical protein [Amycolatopsis sp. GM8]
MTVTDFIAARELASLLATSEDQLVERAAAIASRIEPDKSLRLGRQPAARTAETLRVKYSLARDRGVRVEGLDELVARLSPMGDTPIRACVAESVGEFVLVVVNDDADVVESVLHVNTERPM